MEISPTANGAAAQDGWATASKSKRQYRNKRQRRPTATGTGTLPLSVEYIHPTDTTLKFQPFMILLCGIPGAGKSTFARALEQAMPYKVRNEAMSKLASQREPRRNKTGDTVDLNLRCFLFL
jgi:predicted alpha/beta-fold hydrolase